MRTRRPTECCVAGIELQITGSVLRTARVRSEHYVRLENASDCVQELRKSELRADIFTFLSGINHPMPNCSFHQEAERLAVLPITTYDEWFSKQLYNKPRNALRKALKSGIEVRLEEFGEPLLFGIKAIYDESPVRQGRRNRHYKKDLGTIRREHATFLETSQFIAVYFAGEMIGFAKVTFAHELGFIMNFLSKISHRDKAANNAILAKAVEICGDHKVQRLVYGVWGSAGSGGLAEFKAANGFQCVEVPRYYVPLTLLGRLALRAGIHGGIVKRVPKGWIAAAANARKWWNDWRFRSQPA
jgi:hypothetical protein